MNTKYLILIVALLAVIHYLLAGSAPPATPARVAPQAPVGRVATPSSLAPIPTMAPVAPIGPPPPIAPGAPVAASPPIAPLAPVSPTPPQSVNSNFRVYPYAYTYTHGSNAGYFTNGIPTAYLRNTNSVNWATSPPYGNPVAGYTNNTIRVVLPYRPIPGNTSSPSMQH